MKEENLKLKEEVESLKDQLDKVLLYNISYSYNLLF
jgi:hypothetical protein